MYSMQIMVCEMINPLVEIRLEYAGNMKVIYSMRLIAQL